MTSTGSSTGPKGRCRCGRSIDRGHRFCPSCGSPADGVAEAPLLIDPMAKAMVSEHRVRTGGSGLTMRLIGLAAVAVIGVLAWGLFRQPADETLPEDEAVADPVEAEPARAQGTEDDTAESSGGVEVAEPEVAESGPLLGEPTGLALALGRVDRTGVQIIDLDTGSIRDLERARGVPVGMVESSLVIQGDSGSPRLIDLADLPDEPEIILPRVTPGWSEVLQIDDDRVWVLEDGPDGPHYRAYGPDGELVEAFDPTLFGFEGAPYLANGNVMPWAGLISHPAGGVYRDEGDGYRRVADGLVLAAGERLAVIQQCDETLDCQLRWYHLDTAGVVGFPAPPPTVQGSGFYQIVGGDRWLVHFDWRSGTGELIEIATSRVVRDLDMVGDYFGPRWTVSSDGRWGLDRVGGSLVVVDLDDGTAWDLDLPSDWGGVFIKAVPTAAIAAEAGS